MGGVDLSDQLMNYYNFLHRSCKWWWKLWVHLFNMVILNGHVLNRAFGHQNNMSHYEYRYMLVGALLEYTEVPQPLQPVGHPNDVRNAHWPERLPKSNKKNQTKTRKCKFCYVSRKKAAREHLQHHDKSTTIICSVCKVALCIYPCFRLYHVQN